MIPTQLPLPFLSSLYEDIPQHAEAIIRAMNDAPPVTAIRFNRHRYSPEMNLEPIPWVKRAYYLEDRPSFWMDPLFHAGCYYVQDASAMLLQTVLDQHQPERNGICVLDLCAAPGGKSTLLLDAFEADSIVIANEIHPKRSMILLENLQKWGAANQVITRQQAATFVCETPFIDVLVVDAPCSGEGMFRKDPAAVSEWSPEAVEQCAVRQLNILHDIWPALKPGGLLIYATCTLNRLENEDTVSAVATDLGADVLPLNATPVWNVFPRPVNGGNGLAAYPGLTRGEGQVVFALRKHGESIEGPEIDGRVVEMKSKQGTVHFPSGWRTFIRGDWQILQFGVLIPTGDSPHEMSFPDAGGEFRRIELKHSEALAVLRGESLRRAIETGPVCFTFAGCPIAFGKAVSGRINNRYPKPWRIRNLQPDETDLFTIRNLEKLSLVEDL